MMHILPGQHWDPNIVMCRYEEGRNLDCFMAKLWMACDEGQPDCRRQLLQTVKECFRQILKVSFCIYNSVVLSLT